MKRRGVCEASHLCDGKRQREDGTITRERPPSELKESAETSVGPVQYPVNNEYRLPSIRQQLSTPSSFTAQQFAVLYGALSGGASPPLVPDSSGRSSFDSPSQVPMASNTGLGLNDLIQLRDGAAGMYRRQLEMNNRAAESNNLSFTVSDLLRLSQQQANTGAYLTNPVYPFQDTASPGSNGGYMDPRLSSALAARFYPDLYNGGSQQQLSALTQCLLNQAPAPQMNASSSPSSGNIAYGAGIIESPYGSLNRFTVSTTASETRAATSIDASNSDDRLVPISLPSDEENLSEYQSLVRKQIHLFKAKTEDADSNAQGRNRPIVLGQVGIQCRFCCNVAPGRRSRGAVYFPAKLHGLYQAAQNMAINHFTDSCQNIPEETRARIRLLKEQKSPIVVGGKQYWANGARVLGIKETEDGLVFDEASRPR